MSKTSDRAEVLSLAIARHFEPVPSLASRDEIEEWLDACRKTDDEPKLSSQWWDLTYQVSGIGYVHNLQLHARKITEPEIAMKLLKELLAIGFRMFKDERTKEFVLMRVVEGKHQGTADKEPELAIAEAVIKAFNLEVG